MPLIRPPPPTETIILFISFFLLNCFDNSKPNVALPCKVKGPSKGCIKLYPSFSASKTSLNAVFGLVYLIIPHIFVI